MASNKNQPKMKDSGKDFLKKQQKEINKQFGQATKLYDTQLSELQALQPQYEQTVTAGYEAQKPILQESATKALADIGLQKENVGQTRESALSTARRQYEQGLQRSQQVFGGVAPSMAGQASADILGAEQLRQTGQATTQASQNLMALGGQEREVQANLANQLQQLEVRKQQDIMRLRDTFRQEINAINTQKGALAQNKANAQLQALQDYNNRKRQLEDYARQQADALKNYEAQLRLQRQYTPATNTIAKLPSFANMNAQEISDNIANLRNTDEGRRALMAAGWNATGLGLGNKEVWSNQRSGYTVDLTGKRYADFALDKLSNLEKSQQTLSELAKIQ